MPNWTLADITSRATAAIGKRADIALSTASFWANEALRMVWDEVDHDQKQKIAVSSTTSGENRITLPSDFQALLNISITSAGRDILTMTNYDAVDSIGTGLGTPTKFVLYADWLELYPTPDSMQSIQIRYEAQPSEMTALTSLPSVATRFRQAVFLKTKELLAEHEALDSEGAALARNAYVSYMNSTPSDLALRQRSREGAKSGLPWRYERQGRVKTKRTR